MDAIRNALVLVALGVLGTHAALANPAFVSAVVGGPTAGSNCYEKNSTGSLLAVSCSDGPRGGSASAVAEYRHVGVAATSFIGGTFEQGSGVVVSGASARMNDYLTVASPGRTGVANLTFSFVLNSVALNSTDADSRLNPPTSSKSGGTADIEARLNIAGQTIRHSQSTSEGALAPIGRPVERTTSSRGSINNVAVANALGTYQYSVPITLGQEFSLEMSLIANTYVTFDGSATASASVNAMNSFDWDGIQGVTVNGQPVEFSVTSQSGTDWASPIPELPTIALLIGGLGVVLRRAARTGRADPVK